MIKIIFFIIISNLIFSFEFYVEPKIQSFNYAKEKQFITEYWEDGHPNFESPQYDTSQHSVSFLLAIGFQHFYKLKNNYSILPAIEVSFGPRIDMINFNLNLIKQMDRSSFNFLLAARFGVYYISPKTYNEYTYYSWNDTYSYYTDTWQKNNRKLDGLILGLSYNMELINKKYYSQNIKFYFELNLSDVEDDRYISVGISSQAEIRIFKYILKPQSTIL